MLTSKSIQSNFAYLLISQPKLMTIDWWLMIAYIVLFSALVSRLTAFACGSTWVTSFIARFLNTHWSGVLTALAWLVPHETAAVSAQVLCTPYNHAPCHFMQSHIRKVYACLAVTCHLHFWQNDRDLLHATAVTRGWNGYRNKIQHRKSTLEKKILPPLQQGFEPATFQSRVRLSNHWAIFTTDKSKTNKSSGTCFPLFPLGKIEAKRFKSVSVLNAPRFLLAIYKLCDINPLNRWRLYVTVLASVCRQFGFGLSYMPALSRQKNLLSRFLHTSSWPSLCGLTLYPHTLLLAITHCT